MNILLFLQLLNFFILGDTCCNPLSLGKITKVLEKNLGSNSYVKSLQIGKSFEQVL